MSRHRFSDAVKVPQIRAPLGAEALPALEGVFLFQMLKGNVHLRLETVSLVHQGRKRRGVVLH